MRRPALRRLIFMLPPALLVVLAGLGLTTWLGLPRPLSEAEMAATYDAPRAPAPPARAVFHLGHSLVGRDMPAMLAQLAGPEHRHESQLGWGTSLKAHWEPEMEIAGFEAENDHPRARPAAEALASGDYDAVVLTEMVEIRDAIRYHDSDLYLRRWVERARAGNPQAELFLYETWHPLDDPDGWLARIDGDLDRHWLGEVLHPALAAMPEAERGPVYLIPGGQVMAALVRRIEDGAGLSGLSDRTALFSRGPDGTQDQIHFNDHGAYLIALTHYAVLYMRSPVGLPHDLLRADGTPMTPLAPEAAAAMQQVVWDVVAAMPLTGIDGATGETGPSGG